jgi:homogentisate 1,2-dioxygenase
MAFMWETRHPLRATEAAMDASWRQTDYDACWAGFEKAKLP